MHCFCAHVSFISYALLIPLSVLLHVKFFVDASISKIVSTFMRKRIYHEQTQFLSKKPSPTSRDYDYY